MIWQDVQKIRDTAPLVLNLTNYVVMNTTANALLALGASPVMAHAIEEVEEMAGLAQALVINIGTLSTPWVAAMIAAGKAATRRGIPVVLDPVGAGATRFRTDTALRLIAEARPAIIRGNASEIRSLVRSGAATKGVDSTYGADEVAEEARALAKSAGCVVSVSGATDLIVDAERTSRVANGEPIMTRVIGMGCTASALTGAFAAVNPSPREAAQNAMAVMGIAGELAAARAAGPGSFQMHFLDVLHRLEQDEIASRARVSV